MKQSKYNKTSFGWITSFFAKPRSHRTPSASNLLSIKFNLKIKFYFNCITSLGLATIKNNPMLSHEVLKTILINKPIIYYYIL